MRPQNEIALIIAYYLSRLDKRGYLLLGYKSFNEAAKKIGAILDVKPNTIKNMRDEFDPYNQNSRIGWKRELRGSRQKVMEALQETDENILFEMVKEMLFSKDFKNSEEYDNIRTIFKDKGKFSKNRKPPIFIVRGPTGKAAESIFVKYFHKTKKPVDGKLLDCRELGCGYDFKIKNNKEKPGFVEVKGLFSKSGGILFTNKEWQTALEHRERYYVVLVKNISAVPEIVIIQDPASKINARKNIYTTIQVNWGVSEKELSKMNNTRTKNL